MHRTLKSLVLILGQQTLILTGSTESFIKINSVKPNFYKIILKIWTL